MMSSDTDNVVAVEAPPKEKLRTIMDAASALTSLGDEEGSEEAVPKKEVSHEEEELPAGVGSSGEAPQPAKEDDSPQPSSPKSLECESSTPVKRYLPEHKKPDAAPTFPEKMMNLMQYVDQFKDDETYCIAWLPEGKSFVIRNPDDFSRKVVPKFFKPTKFSSFTRKLYRWGFRQINRGIGPDDPIIFGNEYFDRDNAELMAKMRSITAAGARKADQNRGGVPAMMGGAVGKRAYFDAAGMYDQGTPDKKRLFDHVFNQKANMMNQGMPFYGAAMGSNGGPMSIGNIPMRPSMGGPGMGAGHMMGANGLGMDGSGHGGHPQQYFAQSQQMMGGYGAVSQPPHKPFDMMQQQQSHMQQQSQMQHMQALPHGMGTLSPGGYNAGMQQMQIQQQMQQHYQMMQQQMHSFMPNGEARNSGVTSNVGNDGSQGMMEQELQGNMQHQQVNNGKTNGVSMNNVGSGNSIGGMNNSGSSNHNGMASLSNNGNNPGSNNGSYPSTQSTAEIVNAAIAALRYAN